MVAAIDGSPKSAPVVDAAIEFARLFDRSVEVLHVVETDVIEELAVDRETLDAARDIVTDPSTGFALPALTEGGTSFGS